VLALLQPLVPPGFPLGRERPWHKAGVLIGEPFLTTPEGSPIISIARVSRLFTGGFEFVFILFIAFLLFGPKKLPEIARVLGKGLGELRRASNELKFSLEEEIRNLDREAQTERQTIKPADPPAYTREHRETVMEASSAGSDAGGAGATSEATPAAPENADRQLAVSAGELTETVTDNGHNHRDAALLEPGARS